MAETFIILYNYQIHLNLYHFQTESYGGHKASDEHLAKFRIHFDRFLEVWQGIFGKIKFKKPKSIQIANVESTTEIVETTKSITKYLNDLANELEKLDLPSLVSLIDEMVADNYQFLYLLTFN